ncbi:hypothetical protein OUZ56_024637 [Daphnia magna]|uniref:Uncharacterized protein n=1 Tax=Daphnia magna TaxID=35525 RepID=A0ABR0B153_9CRUS|nr:hypothetical protein OUZ56_024637 [Daphnia magna]
MKVTVRQNVEEEQDETSPVNKRERSDNADSDIITKTRQFLPQDAKRIPQLRAQPNPSNCPSYSFESTPLVGLWLHQENLAFRRSPGCVKMQVFKSVEAPSVSD